MDETEARRTDLARLSLSMDVAKSESEEVPSDLGADTAAAKVEAHADGVAATNSITYGQDADAIDAFLHSDDEQVDDYDYILHP